jgi:hypothetical protein
VSAAAFARTNLLDEAGGEAEEIETPPVLEESSPAASGGSSYKMADLEIEKEYLQITYRFEGYTDTIDDGSGQDDSSSSRSLHEGGGDDPDEVTSFRISYKSNGTCRPYRVRVIAGEDESTFKLISINMLGSAKIEEDEF